MVTPNSTQVIDPEFAFFVPMGFDIGAFVGNLILAFFAQGGHADEGDDRKVRLCIFLSSLCFHSLFIFSSYWVSFCLSVCLYHPQLPPPGRGFLVPYDHLLQVIVLARKKKKNKKGQSNCITHTIFRRQNIFLAEGAQIASREGVKTQENEFKPLLVVF